MRRTDSEIGKEIIFLDIDGVLNTESQWKRLFSLNEQCITEFCDFARKLQANVVLTSTWKDGFVGDMDEKNLEHIKNLEKYFSAYGIRIVGVVPTLKGRTRDKEIDRYVYLNNVKRYIVIDDDKSLYETIDEHYYFTDSKTGFTKKDVIRCEKRMADKRGDVSGRK